ncbi:MAG TPA: ComF family protein [Longimicrobiales bacterium]|nr:ComF family protein [Longimicrobiales bacterium]
MGLLDGLLTLALAPRCLGCGGATRDPRALVCGRCRSRIQPPPAPLCPRCGMPRLRTGRAPGPRCQECLEWPVGLRAARSACLLHHPADALVHHLKYRGWKALASFMAHRMAALPLPEDVARETRIVIAVPTTRTRLRERGYNQAEVLAARLARATGRTLLPALRRAPGTSSQTTLQPAARLANVAGAFRPMDATRNEIAGEHLLLVDDVLTTGATAVACAETLMAAGARCVSVLTFARAPGRLRTN